MKAQFRTKAVLTLAAMLFVVGAINGTLQADGIVYEPFDYPVPTNLPVGSNFSGTTVGAETGLTGTWTGKTGTYNNKQYKLSIDTPTLDYGILPVAGQKLRFMANSGAWAQASIDPANLVGNLDDGDVLWFGSIVNLIIGTPASMDFRIGTDQDNALGWTVRRLALTSVEASSWVDGTKTFAPTSPVAYPANISLIVGKITFGATDTVDIYLPDTNLALGSPVATISAALDQSTFDYLKIQGGSGNTHWIDEIRIGTNYADMIVPPVTPSYWDLNGAGDWDANSENWSAAAGGGSPAAWTVGNTAVFAAGTDTTGTYTVTVDGTQDIHGLHFTEGTVTLSGGTALRMVQDSKVYVEPGFVATIATPLSDDGGTQLLTKIGAGTLILSGDNSAATGGMELNEGVTRFESPAAINGTARNVTVGASGVLEFGPSFGAGNIPAALLDRVVANSTGVIAADNYAGTDFDFATAGLTDAYLGAVGSVTYTGTLTPNGAYRLGGGGGTLIISNTNAVTGSATLTVNGNVTLAGDNDYTGATTVNAGATLTLQGNSTSGVTVNAGTLVLLGSNSAGAGGVTLNTGAALIVGDDVALGSGTLTITGASSTVQAEGTVVTTNSVAMDNNFTIVGTGALTLGNLTLNNNRTITNTNTTATTTIGDVTAPNARSLYISGDGDTVITGVISPVSGTTGLKKSGAGTLTLTNDASTYTGVTSINGGTMSVSKLANGGSPSSIGKSSNASTNLVLGNGGTLQYTGTGDSTNRLFKVTNNGNDYNFTIDASGSGAIQFTNTGSVAFSNTNKTGTKLTFTGDYAGDNTFTPVIADAGTNATAVTKSGDGQWILTGASTYTGATTINGGTLLINGNQSLATGAVAVNDGGTLGGNGTIGGAVTVASGGAALWDFDGTTGSMLTLQSDLQFDSGWKLTLSGSGTPSGEYDLLTYTGDFVGTIAGVIDASAVTGWPMAMIGQDTTPGAGRIYLKFGAGDADGNGVVNAADYMALKRHMGMGSGATLAMGNFDGDSDVDYADLQLLISNYGETSAGAGTIPEPATLFVMMAAGLPALLKRRRRRS